MALPGRVVHTRPPLIAVRVLADFPRHTSAVHLARVGNRHPMDSVFSFLSISLQSQKVPLVCADCHTSNSGQDPAILGSATFLYFGFKVNSWQMISIRSHCAHGCLQLPPVFLAKLPVDDLEMLRQTRCL